MREGPDDQLLAWRHDLHRMPELAMQEHRTSDYLATELDRLGLDVTRGVGNTGLVATIDRGRPTDGRRHGAVALRAEMDGLPLPERGDRPYRSEHDGVTHACGHDGHMAMLLGAARALAADDTFDGVVHLVLQPAEEPGLGAAAMLDDGLFDRFPVDAIFGLHNLPGLPAGQLATRPGPLMASEDLFEVRITGRGGHAARPDTVIDPIVVAAQVVLGLQSIVSRNVEPTQAAVVSCTEVLTDGARNAIPGTAVVRGDTRSFTPEVRDLVERRIGEIASGIGQAHGATCEVDHARAFEPTVNDPGATALAVTAAERAVGRDLVDPAVAPWTASEDFGAYLRVVPGCFVLLGTGDGAGGDTVPLHSPEYDFDDAVLGTGVAFLTEVAHATLAREPEER